MRKSVFAACFFLLPALFFGILHAQEVKTGTISGQLMIKGGGPMAGGTVSFFNELSGPPPQPEKYWRIPDHIVKLDGNGRFTADIVEGNYYIGAMKRVSGVVDVGPPQEGDYLFASRDEKSAPKSYVIRAGRSIDIGVISGVEPYRKPARPDKDISAVTGTVVDAAGKPVKGSLIYAFRTSTEVGKPVFICDSRTDSEGKFYLRVAGDMKYFLKVRDVYGGGPPLAGETVGVYGESEAVAVFVKKGEIVGNIKVKTAKFPGRGPQSRKERQDK